MTTTTTIYVSSARPAAVIRAYWLEVLDIDPGSLILEPITIRG